MRKIAIISLLCLSSIAATSSFASTKASKPNEQKLDKIVAIVNEDVITDSEFSQALAVMKIQMSQAQKSNAKDSELKKQTMEQLINKRLQLQVAKQSGVQVSDEELARAIEQVAQSNNVTTEELMAHVNEGGMTTDDYRNEVKDQLTLQKLQQQEFAGKIPPISPKEVTALMRSKTWQSQGTTEKEYHLEDVLIPVSDTPTPREIDEAKTQAEAVLSQLQHGKNIEEIKRAQASGQKALEGGDLGWRKLDDIPSAFTEQVGQMQDKEVAGPIQTSNGFHLVHLVATRSIAGTQTASNDRQQAEQFLLQRRIDEALKTWMSKLRSQAYIDTNPEKA